MGSVVGKKIGLMSAINKHRGVLDYILKSFENVLFIWRPLTPLCHGFKSINNVRMHKKKINWKALGERRLPSRIVDSSVIYKSASATTLYV